MTKVRNLERIYGTLPLRWILIEVFEEIVFGYNMSNLTASSLIQNKAVAGIVILADPDTGKLYNVYEIPGRSINTERASLHDIAHWIGGD